MRKQEIKIDREVFEREMGEFKRGLERLLDEDSIDVEFRVVPDAKELTNGGSSVQPPSSS